MIAGIAASAVKNPLTTDLISVSHASQKDNPLPGGFPDKAFPVMVTRDAYPNNYTCSETSSDDSNAGIPKINTWYFPCTKEEYEQQLKNNALAQKIVFPVIGGVIGAIALGIIGKVVWDIYQPCTRREKAEAHSLQPV